MEITTNNGNTYSYLPKSNEIIFGSVAEKFEWTFNPLIFFRKLPNLRMFIIGMTEQCNLRCRYCCYSGDYHGKRSHGYRNLSFKDIDSIIEFIETTATDCSKRIAFYGGEPLLNFVNIQYCVDACRRKWGQTVSFSISTNGTLLTPPKIDWLIDNDVEIAISLDGPKCYHDKNRIYASGYGSFDQVRETIAYIYNHYQDPNVSFHVTLANVRDIISVAEAWHQDELLNSISPTMVHGLTPNFEYGVNEVDYDDIREFYSNLIDAYQSHSDWQVLRVFLEEAISAWKERLIFDVNEPIEMSTCLPVNTKLYIDSKREIAVCEKFSDDFRIGTTDTGIDWGKANKLIKTYYDAKVKRCSHCPIVRMCDLCLTAIEYTPEQMKVLCHNERVYARVALYTFCEMAERGMIQ